MRRDSAPAGLRPVVLAAITVVVTVIASIAACRRLRSVVRSRLADTDVYAHRGFASVAPENTTEAVQYAARRADAVEVDVRRCGSGELVCVHDPDLERVAGLDRRVGETDRETLRELSVQGTDATVASLDDVLAVVPDGTAVNLELKERTIAGAVLEAVERHGVDATLSSFDPVVLAEVRAHDETISLAYVFRSATEVDRALSLAAEYDCDAVHPRADLVFRSRIVPRAHRRGLAVNVWAVDSGLGTATLALAGVDGVFADRPPCGWMNGG